MDHGCQMTTAYRVYQNNPVLTFLFLLQLYFVRFYISSSSERDVCFKLPINSFAISDQMFDVACYPWRVIRFDSYNFVRNRFVCCVKYNF